MIKINLILVFLGFVILNANCQPNLKSNDQKVYQIIFGNEGQNGIPLLNDANQIEIEKEVIEKRLKSYGFSSGGFNLNIEKGADIKDYKIVLQIEKNDSLKLFTSLLGNIGKIEFRETWRYDEVFPYLVIIDSVLKEKNINPNENKLKHSQDENILQEIKTRHPLFSKLLMSNPKTTQEYGSLMKQPKIVVSHLFDTAKVNSYFLNSEANSLIPSGIKFKWTLNISRNNNDSLYELIAVKELSGQKAPLGSDDIAVNNKFSTSLLFENKNKAEIEINMNSESTNIWHKMTLDNIDRSIAIIVDGHVYMYPTVINEIPNGRCVISQNNFSNEQLKILSAIINGGELHLPIISIKE
jgi:SecD/SecF fusion protein